MRVASLVAVLVGGVFVNPFLNLFLWSQVFHFYRPGRFTWGPGFCSMKGWQGTFSSSSSSALPPLIYIGILAPLFIQCKSSSSGGCAGCAGEGKAPPTLWVLDTCFPHLFGCPMAGGAGTAVMDEGRW